MKSLPSADHLKRVERNQRALLYKARWDKQTAMEIVPPLIQLLKSDDPHIVLRTLAAFICIGPEAHAAATELSPLLDSSDERICNDAAVALALVSLRKPQLAVRPLMELSKKDGRLKHALIGLVALGPGAKRAGPVYAQAYQDDDARIRRLALRGLKESDVDAKTAVPVLRKALSDRSKEIRTYAKKILAAKYSDSHT